MAILGSSYVCTATYLKYHFNESWGTALLYPFYHGRNLFRHFKRSALAIWQGDDLPEEPDRWEISAFSLLLFCQMRDSSAFSICIHCNMIIGTNYRG